LRERDELVDIEPGLVQPPGDVLLALDRGELGDRPPAQLAARL
jgi:hypothetical protein